MRFVSENSTVHYGYEVGKGEMGLLLVKHNFCGCMFFVSPQIYMDPIHSFSSLALKGNLFFSQESLFTVLGDYN